jgi:hypothetical protein
MVKSQPFTSKLDEKSSGESHCIAPLVTIQEERLLEYVKKK